MHLRYRGNTYYRLANQTEPVESVITAKYRGVAYLIDRSYSLFDSQRDLYVYRGVTYLKSII